jgi:hypothetical protein
MFRKACSALRRTLLKAKPIIAAAVLTQGSCIVSENQGMQIVETKSTVKLHCEPVPPKKAAYSALFSVLISICFNLSMYFVLSFVFGDNFEDELLAYLCYPCFDLLLVEIERLRTLELESAPNSMRSRIAVYFSYFIAGLFQIDTTLRVFGLIDLFNEQWGDSFRAFLGFHIESPVPYTKYVEFNRIFTKVMAGVIGLIWLDLSVTALHGTPKEVICRVATEDQPITTTEKQ